MEDDEDYYGEEGCCLTCPTENQRENIMDDEGNCLCFECKCTKCFWYEPNFEWEEEGGKCTYREPEEKHVECVVNIKHQTKKAFLIKVDDREIWLPKSQVKIIEDLYKDNVGGDATTVIIPQWLIKRKGFG